LHRPLGDVVHVILHGLIHLVEQFVQGDLASMDADGCVAIVGRLKDVIIRGGENIAPREVEEYLQAHPAVGEAQVIGLPSTRYGEEVMAWVRLKAGHSATAEELTEYCRAGLASFKVPRFWKFVDKFPLTVTGKVQKHVMREASAGVWGQEADGA
jgi:fatty-acyl-CoA synthase